MFIYKSLILALQITVLPTLSYKNAESVVLELAHSALRISLSTATRAQKFPSGPIRD